MIRLLLTLTLCISLIAHAAEPVATVDGIEVSSETFDAALALALSRGQPNTTQTRTQVRDQLLAEELMWQRAKAEGVDRDPATLAAIERAKRQAAIATLVSRHITPDEPSEQALRARYEDIVAKLGPREYRLSLIQSANEAAVRAAEQHIADGASFAAEARRVSQVPSAARGGELDWISFRLPVREGQTNGLPTPLARAVLDLTPGRVSGPIDLGDSWALVRLDAVRETMVPDFSQVRDALRSAFIQQSTQAQTKRFVIELMRDAKIRVNR
jgi:parvulin-like peptidyl-prolyl isomerase